MYTFDIILNIIMTAILAYVNLNTIFKFHFSIDRIWIMFFIAFFLTVIWYQDTDKVFEFIITSGIVFIVFAVMKFYTFKKKNFGYFLFNVYRKDFLDVHQELIDNAKELEIERKNICHYRNKPFLVVIKNEEPKKVSSLFKKIDTIHAKGKKTFTMLNYWIIVAFIILEIIIWRF